MTSRAPSAFIELIKRAESLSECNNVEELKDLIKLVMRPVQSQHLLQAYLTEDHKGLSEIRWQDVFGIHGFGGKSWIEWFSENSHTNTDKSQFPRINLSTDIISPTPWHPTRILRNLGSIGENRRMGRFEQKSDHIVSFTYPLMVTWVEGGNHSIMQWILNGGSVIPNEMHDISPLLEELTFDGRVWRNQRNMRVGNPPRYKEIGWIWEISKFISKIENK